MPDYDLIMHPSNAPLRFQHDVEVTSKILGLRLSFKWQPFLNDNVVKLVRQWANSTPSGRPSFILLSILCNTSNRGLVWNLSVWNHRYGPVAHVARTTPLLWRKTDGTGPGLGPAVECHSSHLAQSISDNWIQRRKYFSQHADSFEEDTRLQHIRQAHSTRVSLEIF